MPLAAYASLNSSSLRSAIIPSGQLAYAALLQLPVTNSWPYLLTLAIPVSERYT